MAIVASHLGAMFPALQTAVSQYADERHALLECSSLTVLRQRYGQHFSERNSMREFLWQNDMVQLARYVCGVLEGICGGAAMNSWLGCWVKGFVVLLSGHQPGGAPKAVNALALVPLGKGTGKPRGISAGLNLCCSVSSCGFVGKLAMYASWRE